MFGKKIKGPIDLHMEENQFCAVWQEEARNCVHTLRVNAPSDHYTLLFQDGKCVGMPQENGGPLYPFSVDPRREGSRSDKKTFGSAKAVCISSTYEFRVPWGTNSKYTVFENGRAFDVGASGTFFVAIDGKDAGKNAQKFYRTMLSHGNAAEMDTKKIRDKLRDQFHLVIGEAIEKSLKTFGRPYDALIALTPSELRQISAILFKEVQTVFEDHGLAFTPGTINSLLGNLLIERH